MTYQNSNMEKMPLIRSGLKRPNWICSNARQDVVLVRDDSGSMSGEKARDASAACVDLLTELALPSNKDGFSAAIIDFSSSSRIVHGIQKVGNLITTLQPLLGDGDLTNITAGLEDALSILELRQKSPEADVHFLRPVTIVFTDGCHNHGPAPENAADRLKKMSDLVTVAFGDDADEALLRRIATSSQHFYRCADGRELRSFLAAVGRTLTRTLPNRQNATPALATIQQNRGRQ